MFFSRTSRPISAKLVWKHAWGMGIQICSNKGADPFWYLVWIILWDRGFKFVQI